MLEQEVASLIRLILDKSGNPSPYYQEVPEDFIVPAAYFPPPELDTTGDTLSSYAIEYVWYVKFFHSETNLAYSMGLPVLHGLVADRNLVPLIDVDEKSTEQGFYINRSSLRRLEGSQGVAQLELSWKSRRPYNNVSPEKVMLFDFNLYIKEEYEKAISRTYLE